MQCPVRTARPARRSASRRLPSLAALVVFGLAACDDSLSPPGGLAGPPPGGPRFQIVDAAHNGGTAHFYPLPPLVPQPATSGTFDGTLAPSDRNP